MKIDISEADKVLEELGRRDISLKGMQPELVLNCFRKFDSEDTNCCDPCWFYSWKCRHYLKPYRVK